jgi:hypothetical protein
MIISAVTSVIVHALLTLFYSLVGLTIVIVLVRLLIGLYKLTRLEEVIVSVATKKIMVWHEEIKTKAFQWHRCLLRQEIGSHGLKLLRDLNIL